MTHRPSRTDVRKPLALVATLFEESDARVHIEAALETIDELPPTPLVECPVCGRVGLPERILARESTLDGPTQER